MKKGRGVNFCNHNNDLNSGYKNRVEFKDYKPKHRTEFNKDFQLFSTKVHRQRYGWAKDFGCQCNIRSIHTVYCSPRREEIVYYSGLPTQPKQVYAYSRARSYTDIGVGSVVVQQKKRVRKIYLPETENRGVGSTDLTALIKSDKRNRYIREDYPRYAREEYARNSRDDFYFPKKTSSKCVGGAVDDIKRCTEKLSPIICYTRSKGTSPNKIAEVKAISKDIGNNTIDKNLANITTQVESTNDQNAQASSREIKRGSNNVKEMVPVEIINSVRSPLKKNKVVDNVTSVRSPIKKIQEFAIQKSSDSLEQHVHNLEDPSFIPSTESSDPMENKLEKEYRKIFSTKNKDDKEKSEEPIQDLKSTSLLRRRFEALRRGIAKKEENKKKANANITESQDSNPAVDVSGVVHCSGSPTRVDISIESDPPSLEARSYSPTKLFSPAPSAKNRRSLNVSRKKSQSAKNERESLDWPPADKKVDDSDVQGMFQMWGEKFNFEGSKRIPGVSFEKSPKEIGIKIMDDECKTDPQEKKDGKRFFFFKKKSKDKAKSPCKSKKGVTTGRCEVKNCLVLNGPQLPEPNNKYHLQETLKVEKKKSDETDEIIKKTWLQKFIQQTIESRKSLQIRWNNKTYTTSSSTVFELMDNVYRHTEVIIRSQSETSTATSSIYQSYNRPRVNFVQDVEAWMVPKLERDVPHNFFRRNDHQSGIKDRNWFIDKSKAFAHKIELVLHSKNFAKLHRISSEYIRIDIPKGFFSDESRDSEKYATSNSEEVYKIIEYENPESRSQIKIEMKKDIGNCNNEKITKNVSVRDKNTDTRVIETVIKKPPIHRDVIIQGSNVNIPKRRDVIGVGIITHRDIRELGRPISKIEDVTDEESEHVIVNRIKQCEFAESFLRDYYRNWMPLGIDIFSSCASDFYVKCETEESLSSNNNQGDGTKSCPNLKDFNSTTNLAPASSYSYPYKDPTDKSKIITTFKSITQSEPPLDAKRVLPKDSFEVLKKRMLYAYGNKGKWSYSEDQPYSVPSIQDKAEQDALNELSGQIKQRKKCMKRVSITNCDYPSGDKPISFHNPVLPSMGVKPLPGILSFARKSSGSVTKHATINKDDVCDITPAHCKDFCETAKTPNCSKPPPKPKTASTKSSKKSTSDSSSSSKSCPPQNVCSCTCTPKLSSPLISVTCSIQPMSSLSPQNTKITFPPINNIPKVPVSQQQTSPLTLKVAKPCPCDPNKPKKPREPTVPQVKPCPCVKNKNERKSPGQSSQKSPKRISKRSPVTSPTRSQAKQIPSPPPALSSKGSPIRNPLKPSPMTSSSNCKESFKPKLIPCSAQQQVPEAVECACKLSTLSSQSGNPPPCSRCFQKDHSQSSNTNYQHDKSNQPSQESVFSPISPISAQIDPNAPCPGSPCASRLAELAKKAKSLPKMQGLHLKMKPAPNPPKCRSDCPKSDSNDSVKNGINNDKNANHPSSNILCPTDETMKIRIKKETPSTEEILEGLNFKVQDADGQTLYERREYRADGNRETHTQKVMGEMYKINRLATQSSEKNAFKDDTLQTSKSEASIANLIEISFGLKVTQGDKITDINLEGDQVEELDKNGCKGRKPCNANKSQDIFMTSGEAEPAVDDSSDKNDINIKIVIKNFKTKTDKPIKNRQNDDFSREISEKFHSVSTGYSDIIPDNMYSIHRITVDSTTSKSQLPQDISGGQDVSEEIENNAMKTNLHEPIQKTLDAIRKSQETEEIKTLKKGEIEELQMQTVNNKNVFRTSTGKKHCKGNTGEIKKFNMEDFVKPEAFLEVQKKDTYAVLKTEEINAETKKKIHNTEPGGGIQEPEEKNISVIHKNKTCAIKHISEIIDAKSDKDKRMHVLTPTINSYINTVKSRERETKSETDENNDSNNIETNGIKSKFSLDTSENEVVMSREKSRIEKITTSDIITKSKIVNSILETINGTINDAVMSANYIQNVNTKTSDIKRLPILAKDKSESSQRKRSNENIKITPTTTQETERIVISEMMLKSELVRDKSEYGEEIGFTKNYAAMPENKSRLDKIGTCITTALKLDAGEKIQSIETYEEIPANNTFELPVTNNIDTENEINFATLVTCEKVQKYENVEVTNDTDLLLSETMQVIENWQSVFDENEIMIKSYIFEGSDNLKKTKTSIKQTFNEEIANEIQNFEKIFKIQKLLQYPTNFHKPVEMTPDVDNYEQSQITNADNKAKHTQKEPDVPQEKNALPVSNQHIKYSETRLSHTDTDDRIDNVDLANTSEDFYDGKIEIPKPHTRREKKEMLKHVFEKATTQKWKTKGRMKRLRKMLKFILTSDSSEVEEVDMTRKDLVNDVTYSTCDPNYFKATDSMTNYYRIDNVITSDDENQSAGSHPTQELNEDNKCSDSSDYQSNVSKCICNTMAERIQKRGDTFLTGCCCKSPPKIHEQTSCNVTDDQSLYRLNYKAAEYIDVQTQNSVFNSRVTNVMVMKKMESVMTSKTSSEVEKLKVNSSVSPYRDDKECEVRNAKTNTMLGIIDDGKVVIRTKDEKKMSLQTEIVIGWKKQDKKKQKRRENTYFACPADVLQSYETKKAVLEIYTEKTISDDEEKLVAKLPKFLYEKEEEIETNYVNNVLLAHDKI